MSKATGLQAASSAGGVTVVVTRTVRNGCIDRYESWMHGVGEAAGRFPGHLGLTVIRPPGKSRDYTLIFRFDTVEHLRAWEESDERRVWTTQAESLCLRAVRQQAVGMEAWFALPDEGAAAPPKWKMAIVSWMVAFPTVQFLNATLGPLLAPLPMLARGAATGAAMILFMTYAAMPFATRRLSFWLYARRGDEPGPIAKGDIEK